MFDEIILKKAEYESTLEIFRRLHSIEIKPCDEGITDMSPVSSVDNVRHGVKSPSFPLSSRKILKLVGTSEELSEDGHRFTSVVFDEHCGLDAEQHLRNLSHTSTVRSEVIGNKSISLIFDDQSSDLDTSSDSISTNTSSCSSPRHTESAGPPRRVSLIFDEQNTSVSSKCVSLDNSCVGDVIEEEEEGGEEVVEKEEEEEMTKQNMRTEDIALKTEVEVNDEEVMRCEDKASNLRGRVVSLYDNVDITCCGAGDAIEADFVSCLEECTKEHGYKSSGQVSDVDAKNDSINQPSIDAITNNGVSTKSKKNDKESPTTNKKSNKSTKNDHSIIKYNIIATTTANKNNENNNSSNNSSSSSNSNNSKNHFHKNTKGLTLNTQIASTVELLESEEYLRNIETPVLITILNQLASGEHDDELVPRDANCTAGDMTIDSLEYTNITVEDIVPLSRSVASDNIGVAKDPVEPSTVLSAELHAKPSVASPPGSYTAFSSCEPTVSKRSVPPKESAPAAQCNGPVQFELIQQLRQIKQNLSSLHQAIRQSSMEQSSEVQNPIHVQNDGKNEPTLDQRVSGSVNKSTEPVTMIPNTSVGCHVQDGSRHSLSNKNQVKAEETQHGIQVHGRFIPKIVMNADCIRHDDNHVQDGSEHSLSNENQVKAEEIQHGRQVHGRFIPKIVMNADCIGHDENISESSQETNIHEKVKMSRNDTMSNDKNDEENDDAEAESSNTTIYERSYIFKEEKNATPNIKRMSNVRKKEKSVNDFGDKTTSQLSDVKEEHMSVGGSKVIPLQTRIIKSVEVEAPGGENEEIEGEETDSVDVTNTYDETPLKLKLQLKVKVREAGDGKVKLDDTVEENNDENESSKQKRKLASESRNDDAGSLSSDSVEYSPTDFANIYLKEYIFERDLKSLEKEYNRINHLLNLLEAHEDNDPNNTATDMDAKKRRRDDSTSSCDSRIFESDVKEINKCLSDVKTEQDPFEIILNEITTNPLTTQYLRERLKTMSVERGGGGNGIQILSEAIAETQLPNEGCNELVLLVQDYLSRLYEYAPSLSPRNSDRNSTGTVFAETKYKSSEIEAGSIREGKEQSGTRGGSTSDDEVFLRNISVASPNGQQQQPVCSSINKVPKNSNKGIKKWAKNKGMLAKEELRTSNEEGNCKKENEKTISNSDVPVFVTDIDEINKAVTKQCSQEDDVNISFTKDELSILRQCLFNRNTGSTAASSSNGQGGGERGEGGCCRMANLLSTMNEINEKIKSKNTQNVTIDNKERISQINVFSPLSQSSFEEQWAKKENQMEAGGKACVEENTVHGIYSEEKQSKGKYDGGGREDGGGGKGIGIGSSTIGDSSVLYTCKDVNYIVGSSPERPNITSEVHTSHEFITCEDEPAKEVANIKEANVIGSEGEGKEKKVRLEMEEMKMLEDSIDNNVKNAIEGEDRLCQDSSVKPHIVFHGLNSSNSTTMTIRIDSHKEESFDLVTSSRGHSNSSDTTTTEATDELAKDINMNSSLDDLIEQLLEIADPDYRPCGTPSGSHNSSVSRNSSVSSCTSKVGLGDPLKFKNDRKKSRQRSSTSSTLKDSYLPPTTHVPCPPRSPHLFNNHQFFPNKNTYAPHTAPYLCNKSGRPQKVSVALTSSGCVPREEDINTLMSSLQTKTPDETPQVNRIDIITSTDTNNNSISFEPFPTKSLGVT